MRLLKNKITYNKYVPMVAYFLDSLFTSNYLRLVHNIKLFYMSNILFCTKKNNKYDDDDNANGTATIT